MRIASRMAITQFIGGQAVVLPGSSVLVDRVSASTTGRPGVLALAATGDHAALVPAGGDVRP